VQNTVSECIDASRGEIVNSNACLRLSSPLLGFLIVTVALFGCDESSDASSRVNGTIRLSAARGPGAIVSGEPRFDREVKLYVSDRATVGSITGATPIPFSGDSPPN
jgi:hypothetical protein